MPFSALPLVWKIVSLAALIAIVVVVGHGARAFFESIPLWLTEAIVIGAVAFSIGFQVGQKFPDA